VSTAEVRPNQREHILDVALRLMSEHGAAGTSMRRLAAACGVQVAAIYHYFESKDALLAAVVAERQYGQRIADPLPVDPDAPTAERAGVLVRSIWAGALDEQAIWRLVLGEGMRGDPTVQPVGADLLALLQPAAEGWVRQFLPEVPEPVAAATALVGLLLAGFVRHVFEPDLDADAIPAWITDAFLGAVLPDARTLAER
jgi:AcrR family transcriptional regulator